METNKNVSASGQKATAGSQGQVKTIQEKVASEAASDYLVFFGWGLYTLLLIPVFDFVGQAIWGPIVWVVALTGTVATWRYYAQRHRRVRLAHRVGWKGWTLFALWCAATVSFTMLTKEHLAYSYTIGGIALALPIFAYSIWLFQKQR